MEKKSRVLCTICARGGSVGVKDKNIQIIKGKPLIAHSLIQAKQTGLFDVIAVSSDSQVICDLAMTWGADVSLKRPPELATSEAAKLPAIQHAVSTITRQHDKSFDYVIDLDVTSPLRQVQDITDAFQFFVEHPEANNLVSGCQSRRSPYFNMLEVNAQGFANLAKKSSNNITRRQDVPTCYDMNASIYIWNIQSLLKGTQVINDATLLYEMPEERSVDIDTPLDWAWVEFLMSQRKDL